MKNRILLNDFKKCPDFMNYTELIKFISDHTFTPKKILVWVLGMGFITTPKNITHNPKKMGMKSQDPKSQNLIILGMKPKPNYFFHFLNYLMFFSF